MRSIDQKDYLRLRENDTLQKKAMENGESTVESFRRPTEIMDDKTAMLSYIREECETEHDLRYLSAVFRMFGKKNMPRFRQRLAEGDERGSATPRTTDPPEATTVNQRLEDGDVGMCSATVIQAMTTAPASVTYDASGM